MVGVDAVPAGREGGARRGRALDRRVRATTPVTPGTRCRTMGGEVVAGHAAAFPWPVHVAFGQTSLCSPSITTQTSTVEQREQSGCGITRPPCRGGRRVVVRRGRRRRDVGRGRPCPRTASRVPRPLRGR